MRKIPVALLGLGNVGAGVVKLLADNAEAIQHRLGGAAVDLRRILVREADKPRLVDVPNDLLTTDANSVLADDEIKIVIELIGGEEPARRYVLEAIERGKHVVTANKAMLAAHGAEFFAAAEKRGVDLYFEASVGGGVPIIRALREGLASDRVVELVGIVNGTSNFLLTTMTEEGRPFAELLKEAQDKGYAEADPSLDVDGWDAAHKLAVLVPLCFGTRIRTDQIIVEGLRDIEPIDFKYAERFGYVIKPLVIAKDHGDSLEARVHPTLIPRRFMLAAVNGVYNAVYVSSYALGSSMYYGRGAGMMPTAVAVISDVIEVSRNLLSGSSGGATLRLRSAGGRGDKRLRQRGELRSRYYLRFGVVDKPGVLAQIASILGEHEISISEVVQEGGRAPGKPVAVVVTTHEALEGQVQAALALIDELPATLERTRLYRIFETMSEPTTQVRVLYADTDQMGVVNNGVYLRFFEAGRAEWIRKRGLSYKEIEAGGELLPVIEAQLHYHQPARYDDLLAIDVEIEDIRAASLTFQYKIRRSGDGKLLCDGMTRHACMGPDGRVKRFSKELVALLRP